MALETRGDMISDCPDYTKMTFPQILEYNYHNYGDKLAWRQKDLGIWKEYTWRDIYDQVKCFFYGMTKLGLQRGDVIAIIGDNCSQWFWAQLAAETAGAIVTGMFVDSLPDELKYLLVHSDAKFIVVEDQEQVDKIVNIKAELPLLQKLICWDMKGLEYYDEPMLISYAEVLEIGKRYELEFPELIDKSIAKGKIEDIATVLYTSGTSKQPKGALVPYKAMTNGVYQLNFFSPVKTRDDYVSFMLPGWLAEQLLGLATSLIFRTVVNFPESTETVKEDLLEVSPHVLLYAARLWESESSVMQAKIMDTSFVKKLVYNLFLPVGYKVTELRQKRYTIGVFWKVLQALGNMLVFHQIRSRHGLHNVRALFTGGSMLGPDIYLFLRAIGLDLKNVYPTTEAGVICGQTKEDIRFDTVGRPPFGVEVRTTNESEIVVRSESLFSGYYKNTEETEDILKGGWCYTGDAGYFDYDQLVFMDRLKDLKELKDGTKYSPQYLESRLKFSPFIKDALILVPDDISQVNAVINIDFLNTGDWAERNHIPYTTFADLSQRAEVRNLICEHIKGLNQSLPLDLNIKKFVNLYKDFDADEAELTRTKKIRRAFMAERYSDMVAAMFEGRQQAEMESSITYQDGTKRQIDTTVYINSVDDIRVK